MKISRRILIVMLIFLSGFILGVFLAELPRGRQAPVYAIIEMKVKDAEMYARYMDKVYDIVRRHGGRYLVRGGEVASMLGDWFPERIVVIEFASREALDECFGSAEYREAAFLREGSTEGRAIIIEGFRE